MAMPLQLSSRDDKVVLAALQAGVLLRGGYRGVGPPAAERCVADFRGREAADRLAALLDGLSLPVRRDHHVVGGRYRRRLYRVVCTELDGPLLRGGWRTACDRLRVGLAVDEAESRPGHRRELARSAWLAALLVARQGRGAATVRVADPSLARLLVSACDVLQVPVSTHRCGGARVVRPITSPLEV